MQQWLDNFREITDLNAQVEMAYWAKWMLYATFASTGVSVLALLGLLRSLRQTKQAISVNITTENDARRLGEANARAYLHVSDLEISHDLKAAIITVRNTGSTPAPMLYVGCEVKSVSAGRMNNALAFDSYAFKGWHSVPANTDRQLRVDFTRGAEIVLANVDALSEKLGPLPHLTAKLDNVVIVGRIVWNDVFEQHLETGFVFYTEDVRRQKIKIPAGILPAFRLIGIDEVPFKGAQTS